MPAAGLVGTWYRFDVASGACMTRPELRMAPAPSIRNVAGRVFAELAWPMQSIYWVLSWACQRRYPHCYDDRFRPYARDALRTVVGGGQTAWPRTIANLPNRMRWVDTKGRTQPPTVIPGGVELLVDGVRRGAILCRNGGRR